MTGLKDGINLLQYWHKNFNRLSLNSAIIVPTSVIFDHIWDFRFKWTLSTIFICINSDSPVGAVSLFLGQTVIFIYVCITFIFFYLKIYIMYLSDNQSRQLIDEKYHGQLWTLNSKWWGVAKWARSLNEANGLCEITCPFHFYPFNNLISCMYVCEYIFVSFLTLYF